jgi:3-hydroxyacyl-CoA dehydrogenase
MALKKEVFGQLDRACKPSTILASNTSTLNIDEIAAVTSRAPSVIGTHFFSPANVMRLLEIVRGKATSKEVIATCMQLSKRLGKVGVLVGNCRSFVGNRMFHPYVREATFLVEEGASVGPSDKALYDLAWPWVPSHSRPGRTRRGLAHRKEYRYLKSPAYGNPSLETVSVKGPLWPEDRSGLVQYDDPGLRFQIPSSRLGKAMGRGGRHSTAADPADEVVDRCIYAL